MRESFFGTKECEFLLTMVWN